MVYIIQTKLFSNVHNQFTHSLYKKTYWKINRMKIQYFAERGSAEIINTIGMDIDNVSSVVDQITQFSISSILQIIGGVVGLSLLDWKLAILIEAIIPLKFIIVSYCANKKREVFEQWIEDKRKFMSWFAECINGIHEMKLWNLFQVKKSQFEGLQKDLMDSYKKNAMLDEYSIERYGMIFIKAESADCGRRQEQIKAQNQQNYEKYHEGQMSREEFLSEKKQLEEERKRLERRKKELEELINGEKEILTKKNIPVEQMMEYLGYEKLTEEMLEKYVKGIYVYDDGRVEVEWKALA